MGIDRRDVLKGMVLGAGSLLVPYSSQGLEKSSLVPKTKSVIQIWMWGGPCHIDTFDPKPEAGKDYIGPYDSPIDTNVSGIQIGQMLPLLAQQADKYSIIRSMTHGINGHETASYIVQTGFPPGGRLSHPTTGAVIAHNSFKKGYDSLISPYVVLTSPQGRFSESGFLDLKYKPFATGGDPSKTPFEVEGIVAKGISRERQESRRELLYNLDTLGKELKDFDEIKEFDEYTKNAYGLILGDAGNVFDASTELQSLREEYGMNKFGQSCLIARKLVESGVPYVTINYKGWDTHKDHFGVMRRKLPEFDSGLSTLLKDLSEKGLLENTIVWVGGEFGRGPKVQWESPWNGGRNHFGAAFSHLIAGGGFKGGKVVGATDSKGMKVVDRPVYPVDLLKSIYIQMGIDPEQHLITSNGTRARICPTKEDGVKSAGYLEELV